MAGGKISVSPKDHRHQLNGPSNDDGFAHARFGPAPRPQFRTHPTADWLVLRRNPLASTPLGLILIKFEDEKT
jgi:hypothetical protein